MGKPILQVLGGDAVWPPPIWLMRQAGRYLPEFRAIRTRADFLTRCLTPDIAAELTMQPIRRFGMDGAIIFSDILIVPWALGQSVRFVEHRGPVLDPIRDAGAVDRLEPSRLLQAVAPVGAALAATRAMLDIEAPACTLLGFAGGVFTVLCYMIEGGGSRDFIETRTLALRDPPLFRRLVDLLVEATTAHLQAQIDAGAEAIVLFDSWAGILPPRSFIEYVVEPTKRIVRALNERHPQVPIIGFPRLAGLMSPFYAEQTGVDGVGLDTSADPPLAARLIGEHVALQGNLDPVCLLAGGDELDAEATRIATALRGTPHIFNLGHGVLPETDPGHVGRLVTTVRGL